MTTLHHAKELLSRHGLSITKTGNEYRVAFKGTGNEASAYYSDDIDDAIQTGVAMAFRAMPRVYRLEVDQTERQTMLALVCNRYNALPRVATAERETLARLIVKLTPGEA